jgi:hypothetical protein
LLIIIFNPYPELTGGKVEIPGEWMMKTLIIAGAAVAGLAASVSTAFAGGNPPDVYAIQHGMPYDGAPGPIVERAPMHEQAVQPRFSGERFYLPQYRIWVPASTYRYNEPAQ